MIVTPKVIGLDLSITKTGIAHVDGETETVKTRDKDGDKRLIAIRNAVQIAALDADLAVIEDVPPHARGAHIVVILGMVHGVAREVLAELGVPCAFVNVFTLKAYATGKGAGDKIPMAMAAYKRTGKEFPDDNQCDAWWLRLAGLDRLGFPEVDLPQAQRAKLDAGKWPDLTIG